MTRISLGADEGGGADCPEPAVDTLHSEVPEIRCYAPEGTFLAWLDCTRLGFNTSAYDFFHDKARIALSPGENFEPSCAQFVRFNFATSMPILDKLLDRLVATIRRKT